MTEAIPPTNIGVVAMMDALGTRSMNAKMAIDFINIRDELISETSKDRERLSKQAEPVVKAINKDIEYQDPQIVTFADNVLLSWGSPQTEGDKSPDYSLSMAYIPYACLYLGILIRAALRKGVLLRGSVSIGNYIQRESTLLGPAVNDAAGWYEKADWIGIIATPSCGIKLSFLKNLLQAKESSLLPTLDNIWIEYEVPIKSGAKLRSWVISWPAQYLLKKPDNSKLGGVQDFWAEISRFNVPLGTESKFENTIKFFQWFAGNVKV